MDPVTQGALGAAATLAIWGDNKRLSSRVVGWLGALSAMAPDLDILIRSDTDSLLAVEYHRHFTHSLTFVPVGAAIALLPWLLLPTIRKEPRLAYLISLVGYLTHAPLDCATTYGTLWFWPFSETRVSLSWVSVVDPVFTIPLLVLTVMSARKMRRRLALFGLAWGAAYIAMGAIQKARVSSLQAQLIESRGHPAPRRAVYGTFMNQVTFRSIYEAEGEIYVDQIRLPYFGSPCLTQGTTMQPAEDVPESAGPAVRRGYRLVNWFSGGWVARSPLRPELLSDARYSFTPYGTEPFWGLEVNLKTDDAQWRNTQVERGMKGDAITNLIFEVPPGSQCGENFPGN